VRTFFLQRTRQEINDGEQIHKSYKVATRSVERVRQRFVEDGFNMAINGKFREVFKEKIFDGKVEAI